jgi:urease accessory protein UreF
MFNFQLHNVLLLSLDCLQDYSDDDWEQREEERKQQAAAGTAQPSYSKGMENLNLDAWFTNAVGVTKQMACLCTVLGVACRQHNIDSQQGTLISRRNNSRGCVQAQWRRA